MTTTRSILVPISVVAGVQPSTDKSPFATVHFTMADKIRFRFGFPQKIGGWFKIPLANGATILGYARSIFSSLINASIVTLIGTNSKLYSLEGSILTNITPLVTSTLPIATGFDTTYYGGGADNLISTTNHSNIVTFNSFPNVAQAQVGDSFKIAGSTSVGGISSGSINTTHVIHSIDYIAQTATFIVSANATSSTSGGGTSLTIATDLIFVQTGTTITMTNGQRVKINGASNFGGIVVATYLNGKEFFCRNVSGGAFCINIGTFPTSQVSAAGGTSGTYQVEIGAGAINESFGQGYGMGLYGIGLYGTALLSSSARIYPRIWYMDRFGSKTILTAGNQTGLYEWAGSNATAPVLVTNAPAAINYAFVSNNIVVTLGADGTPNRIFACDQGDETNWTGSSSNQVYDYIEVRAGRWISHVSVAGVNLLFTTYQTYIFAYLGYTAGVANAIWSLQQIEGNIGLIGSMARIAVDGVAYWMGQHNFYMWAGANVEVIPANTQSQSTILRYVFDNINRGQTSKFFAWYDEKNDEINFHYCSAGNNEPDRIARVNRSELHWTPDTIDRLAAEYPNQILGYPRLISSSSILYGHEQGNDDDTSPLAFQLESNYQGRDFQRNNGRMLTDDNAMLAGFVPDSLQTGNISVEVIGKKFPQSAANMFDNTYTITPTTEQMPVQGGGRLWKYIISGAVFGQSWVAGRWHQYVQEGSKQ